MLSCKNCDNKFEGKYCNKCGQKYIDERFTIKKTLYETASNVFAFDSGLIFTFIGLFKHPKKVVNDYLNGATKPPVNPFKYLFLAASLSALVSIYFGVFEVSASMSNTDNSGKLESYKLKLAQIDSALLVTESSLEIDSLEKQKSIVTERVFGTEKQEEFLGDYMEYLKKYAQFVTWAAVPFLAFFCWLFFRGSLGYNIAENLIISTFLYAQSSFMSVLLWAGFGIFGFINPISLGITTLLMALYMAYAIFRIYFKKKSFWNMLGSGAIYLLGYLSFMFFLMMVVAVVVAITIIKG